MVREILLLGDPRLYEISRPVKREELPEIRVAVQDLFDTRRAFREQHGWGRAIAAPQIGIHKRLIVMEAEQRTVFINPELSFPDNEMMEVLDDCMSFPTLKVQVMRYRRAILKYLNADWQLREMLLEGDLSELIQHEYDHLDGITATMRAIDQRSFLYQKA